MRDFHIGQAITYSLVFSNVGDTSATGVVITDSVPLGQVSDWSYMASVPVTPTGSDSYTWQVEDLPPGASGQITLTGVVKPDLSGIAGFDNTATITGTTRELTTANNTSSAAVTVLYHLSINAVENGGVTNDPNQAAYAYGTVITLTAMPNPGASFSGWSGDLNGNLNPITITLDANKVVTATFTQNSYSVLTNAVGSGSVAKNPDQPIYHYGDMVTVIATPNTGWAFTGWSGDLHGSLNPITVTGRRFVTATFSTTCLPITAADFSFDPVVPLGNQGVNFTAVLTGGTAPISYTWFFGDGSEATTIMTSIQHRFPLTNTRQTYVPMLTTSNACSLQSVQKSILVRPQELYLPLVLKNF